MAPIQNREEAIAAASAARQEKLQRIGLQIVPDSPEEQGYRFILNASLEGRQKLEEAKNAGNFIIYNDWRLAFKDTIDDDRTKFHKVRALFEEHDIPLLDFIGIDLTGAKLGWKPNTDWLTGLDAKGADFTGANFENADITGFITNPPNRFHWCNFRGANLSNPPLPNDSKRLSDPQYSCFGRMEEGQFDHSDFTGANLSRQYFNAAETNYCNFTGANFHHAETLNGSFIGSQLHGADFSHAAITSEAFRQVEVDDKLNLTGATIEGDTALLTPAFYARWQACNPSTAAVGETGTDKKWTQRG